MNQRPPPIPFDEMAFPAEEAASAEVEAWQLKKIEAGIRDADEGRYASHEAVKAVIRKYIPNG